MQTPGRAAQGQIVAAMGVFKVQFDQPGVVDERSEIMFGVRFRSANPRDGGADLWRQIIDVIGVERLLSSRYPASRMDTAAAQCSS
jgi:hypothetical protein